MCQFSVQDYSVLQAALSQLHIKCITQNLKTCARLNYLILRGHGEPGVVLGYCEAKTVYPMDSLTMTSKYTIKKSNIFQTKEGPLNHPKRVQSNIHTPWTQYQSTKKSAKWKKTYRFCNAISGNCLLHKWHLCWSQILTAWNKRGSKSLTYVALSLSQNTIRWLEPQNFTHSWSYQTNHVGYKSQLQTSTTILHTSCQHTLLHSHVKVKGLLWLPPTSFCTLRISGL